MQIHCITLESGTQLQVKYILVMAARLRNKMRLYTAEGWGREEGGGEGEHQLSMAHSSQFIYTCVVAAAPGQLGALAPRHASHRGFSEDANRRTVLPHVYVFGGFDFCDLDLLCARRRRRALQLGSW